MQVGKIMREADIILYASSYSIGPIYNARVMSDVNVLVSPLLYIQHVC